MPDKAECSVALCTALPGKPLQQRHLMAKNELAFSFRSKRKDQQADGQYANVSCWGPHYTAWDSFWEQLFQCFRVDSLFWENNFIHCTSRVKTLQDVFIHFELCYTLHERSFSKIHNMRHLKSLEMLQIHIFETIFFFNVAKIKHWDSNSFLLFSYNHVYYFIKLYRNAHFF